MPEDPFPVVALSYVIELYLHVMRLSDGDRADKVAQRYTVQVSDTTMMP